jgi:hypothetical protein
MLVERAIDGRVLDQVEEEARELVESALGCGLCVFESLRVAVRDRRTAEITTAV